MYFEDSSLSVRGDAIFCAAFSLLSAGDDAIFWTAFSLSVGDDVF